MAIADSSLRRRLIGACVFVLTLVTLLIGLPIKSAHAIPVFARKYKTSCQTCHTVFPRLTPIGDAFRMNGYRFPSCDSAQVKDEPVSLGAEAYKELYPADSVWPSDLPGTAPLAIVAKLRATAWQKGSDQTSHFAGLNPWFDVYAAATLGENISVFGKFQVNGPSCQNCHTYFSATFQVLRNTTLKVGRFQPELFNFHQQPFYEMHDLFGPQRRVGANAWNYGKDVGVEAAAIWAGRLRTVLGVMEGQDDLNQPLQSKNGYVRAAYRFGGMRMDGQSDPGYLAPTKNWRDRSIQFGMLGYIGSARLQSSNAVGAPVAVDDGFAILGGDTTIQFDDWTVFGGGFAEKHRRPTGTDHNIWAERWFGGIRYVLFPSVVPGVMFDYFNSELAGDYQYQIRPRVDVLARANVKVRVDGIFGRPVGEAAAFRQAVVMLDVGF